ncbi:ketoacyl-ACP synthase III [Risungbinella massiliensis]|uniref:ketoacyl-ACP synthase III n=1 Tax=Risungbinella massiliensis TaxID=1329796 RepID=UPI0005CC140B|nr:ketoacyl-ACP synthase III [Risungbinella massiliensis]
MKARITAIGGFVPEKRLTNHDLEQMVETSDEWIVQRTGIKERRIASESEFTSDLAVKAVENLVASFAVEIKDVDFLLVATTTPDMPMPSVASRIQARLGIPHAGAIDISAACAGFVYALNIANSLIVSGAHRKILVVGAETLSKVTDYQDRTSCILFADGAGAFLVERDDEVSSFIAQSQGADGEAGIHLYCSGLSEQIEGVQLDGKQKIVQNGREIFKKAVHTLTQEVPEILRKANLSLSQLDWFVPHSANLRIIEAATKRIDYPMERVLFSGTYYGNTSSATIPLAIWDAYHANRLEKDQTILLSGFGGGFVYSNVLIRWGLEKKKEGS